MKVHKSSKWSFFLLLSLIGLNTTQAQQTFQLGRLKYKGGGDWYSSKTALKNLALFCNNNIGTQLQPQERIVEVGSEDIYKLPYIFMTGHGNVIFNNQESQNLRNYLISGGFLHICDNYGMNDYVRREMKKVFPELEFIEIGRSHPIFNTPFKFSNGLPKVHEHDGERPQALALIYQGRIVCFYDFESDLGNGWEDAEVHNDPKEIREQALRMGANLIHHAMLSN